jgi:hypothetical protein
MRMMSTDQRHLPTRTPPSPGPPPEPAPTKSGSLDLSVPKIVGGALAAMTTAALASRLGVAGTLIGAAIASVVAAVATSLYTASLRHTGERLRSVIPAGRTRSAGALESDATQSPATDIPAADLLAPSARSFGSPQRRRLNWASIVVGAVAVFALAAAAVTGIELAAGRTFSGGQGTTIGQVSDPAPPSTKPTTATTVEPTTEPTADPTIADAQPSEPAATAPVTPAPAPTRPSPSVAAPEPSASAEPTTPVEPSSPTSPRPSASAPSASASAAPSASGSARNPG